ncbi:NAD(P)/FAD-dependent oxidoreductase [Phytoactinopolyspora halotolerans]|uniref:FAD-binding oxidoreductase n=1 Tax=Phytoactinopolyspora halotolerans TaxID=1981512 RepID=A0A6L9SC71_9ACTN|nr:FAD-dependent oxidoreductase [Phytoactinopolyspora halotolerans]NEE02161.1 FAD-binding oxidoreductase [Phytoactinopolyspora halotolerans]
MTRIAVVGAGIVGAGVAYHLAARGADVVVIDDARPERATAAGAGIIAPVSSRTSDDERSDYMFAAAAHYLELIERFEVGGLTEHSYGATGQLIVALDDAELVQLEAVAERASALIAQKGTVGIGSPEMLTQAEIRRRFPPVTTARGALWLPAVARVDGRNIRELLMTMAAQHGARVVEARAELALTGSGSDNEPGSRVLGVRAGGELVTADAVVVAAGVWAKDVAAETGLDLALYPQRGQIVHLRMPGGSQLPVLNTFRGHYLLSFPGDRVVIGATREDDSGFDAHATAGGVDAVIRNGFSLVPDLSEAEWLEVRVGIRPASRDGAPILGPVPGVDGLWLATGFGATGLTLGPYSAKLLAESVLGGAPAIPAAFAPDRRVINPSMTRR